MNTQLFKKQVAIHERCEVVLRRMKDAADSLALCREWIKTSHEPFYIKRTTYHRKRLALLTYGYEQLLNDLIK